MTSRANSVEKGISLAMVAYGLFAVSDSCVRLLHGRVNFFQLGFYGSVLSLLLLPGVWRRGDVLIDLVRPRNKSLWALRGVLTVINLFSSILAFTHLPMAEAFALIFLMPLLITVFSVVFLGERVKLKAWLAITLGLLGVLTVLRPGFRSLNVGHIAALTCGLSGAGLFVLLRHSRSAETRISLFGAGVICPMLISGVLMVPEYSPPSLNEWLIITAYGLLAALANLLMMQASRYAQASHLAPTQYSQMIWGVGLGYGFFADHVDCTTFIGIFLILAAGLWLLLADRPGLAHKVRRWLRLARSIVNGTEAD